jgi:hypothetical protein
MLGAIRLFMVLAAGFILAFACLPAMEPFVESSHAPRLNVVTIHFVLLSNLLNPVFFPTKGAAGVLVFLAVAPCAHLREEDLATEV